MNGISVRLLGYCAGVFTLSALGWILAGQAAGPEREGIPTDWSHRHVIFSQPSTDAQALAVMNEPRYWQQFNRQHFVRTLNTRGAVMSNTSALDSAGASHADWSQNLGSNANAGAGVYPAKFTFKVTTANCGTGTTADYVVFSTGLPGSSGQADIVAFNNLYTGCGGTVPNVYWAFNTGGQVLTSPTISGDGTQVAFVQTVGGISSLVLLKFAAGGTVAAPVHLVGVLNASYRSCTAPCMTLLPLRTGVPIVTEDDTTSSVFPDYTNDVIYVGGALGWLEKFTGVFRGTPTQVTTGGFPVKVNPTNATALGSPVLDTASGNVFVGDAGGFFYRVSSAGLATKSGQIDFGAGLIAGPIVDSTIGKVYVFSSSDGTTNCAAGTSPCTAVHQLGTSFAANNTGTKAVVGTSVAFPSSPSPLFEGAFDSNYFSSGNGTGNLYVCGNTGGAPTLYQIPINAGNLGTVVTGPALSSTTTGCSPVTDFSNPNASGGTTEWLFAGVQAGGSGNSCGGGGCAMNFVNTPWQPSHAYTVGQQVLDTHFQIETCRVAGTSKAGAHPGWATTVGGSTSDPATGTLRWVNQGPQAAAHGTWLPSHAYAAGNSIIDSNGNIQVVTTAGTSKAGAHPTWQTAIYTPTTVDGGVRWRNAGLPATASIGAAGGTGGIIIDNTVAPGTLAGASQIYFSTQGNQTCGTSGTGGCAVQASQTGLQ